MTEIESQQFITEVLKGFWPDWELTDAQYGLWTNRLKRFQYNKAEDALGDWMVETKRTYKFPPINLIIKYLQAKGAYDSRNLKPDAPIVFELRDQESNRYLRPFCESSMRALLRRNPEEIEQEAMRKCADCNSMYGGRWYIIQTWNLHFGELPL